MFDPVMQAGGALAAGLGQGMSQIGSGRVDMNDPEQRAREVNRLYSMGQVEEAVAIQQQVLQQQRAAEIAKQNQITNQQNARKMAEDAKRTKMMEEELKLQQQQENRLAAKQRLQEEAAIQERERRVKAMQAIQAHVAKDNPELAEEFAIFGTDVEGAREYYTVLKDEERKGKLREEERNNDLSPSVELHEGVWKRAYRRKDGTFVRWGGQAAAPAGSAEYVHRPPTSSTSNNKVSKDEYKTTKEALQEALIQEGRFFDDDATAESVNVALAAYQDAVESGKGRQVAYQEAVAAGKMTYGEIETTQADLDAKLANGEITEQQHAQQSELLFQQKLEAALK